MPQIDNPLPHQYRPDAASLLARKPDSKKKTGKPGFFDTLLRRDDEAEDIAAAKDSEGLASEAALNAQMDEIHRLGDALLKRPGFEQVQAYRNAFKRLLDWYVKHGIESAELLSNRSILNQKKYTIIKVIDEKLDRLVASVLQAQGKQLDLLDRIEEIQGLLVDLLH